MNKGLAATLLALGLSACASHSDKTKPIRTALDAGNEKQALALLNESLDVKTAKDIRDAIVNNATTGKVTNAGIGSPDRLLYSLFF